MEAEWRKGKLISLLVEFSMLSMSQFEKGGVIERIGVSNMIL